MTAKPNSAAGAESASWLAMAIILLAQIQKGLQRQRDPRLHRPHRRRSQRIGDDRGHRAGSHSPFVAAFVMLGAKLGKLFGPRPVFQVAVILHGRSMVLMAFSRDENMMLSAQALAGLAAAALVPTLVILIAANYRGGQQAQALALLAGAPAVSGVLAFLIAGYLGTASSWRYSFGLLFFVSLIVLLLSFRLKPIPRHPDVRNDAMGAVLAAIAIILISFGFNKLNAWGIVLAKPAAPISLLGLSPASFMIVVGIAIGQAFFARSQKRVEAKKTPLLALEVIEERHERSAILAFMMISALGPAVNFLIPLYIQIVQGRTSLQTSVAVIPYTLAIFTSAVLIVRLYRRLTPRQIARIGFILVATGLTLLAFTIRNDWGTPIVILGLVILGLGEGALLTLLFNVLLTGWPKELAGDVGAVRGMSNNLSTALGTAFASVAAATLLTLCITSSLVGNPTIPPELKAQVALDNINFVSNDQLLETLSGTTATPVQVAEAVAINAAARLRALRAAFLILAAIALLAIFPARGLPHYDPAEVPADGEQRPAKGGKKQKEAV